MLPYPALLAGNGQHRPSDFGADAGGTGDVSILAGKTAIVVEDEGVTQLQVRIALTKAGMKVLGVARTGREGVELALRTRPQVIVMDIKMPGDIDGLEAARQILAEFDTCVVMLTAFNDYYDEAQKAGASGYVMKPVSFTTLIPLVREAVERRHSA